MKHLIVGNGPAGIGAALTLCRIAPQDQVAVVAEETQPFYSKVLTSYFIGGQVPYPSMLLADLEQLQGQGIRLLTGKRAVSLDITSRELALSGGERIDFDRLLLATGSVQASPTLDGSRLPGVFTLWSHDDAVAINNWVREGQRAVVVGAGLVGLKVAEAFLRRGLSVTAVELLDQVLPQLLVREDAARVQVELEQKGLSLLTGTGVAQFSGEGQVQQVVLTDGTVHQCDVVVMATGVRPNLALAKTAGIAVGRGVLVNELMQTNRPGIYAAGDVAEGWDLVRGRQMLNPTWGNASEQGRVAAYNMAGQRKCYNGSIPVTTFTFLGFSMATVGITRPDSDIFQVESYANPKSNDYRKVVMLGDRLVGGLAMGDLTMAGIWRGLIARRSASAGVAVALLPRKTNYFLTHLWGPNPGVVPVRCQTEK